MLVPVAPTPRADVSPDNIPEGSPRCGRFGTTYRTKGRTVSLLSRWLGEVDSYRRDVRNRRDQEWMEGRRGPGVGGSGGTGFGSDQSDSPSFVLDRFGPLEDV